MVAPPSTRRFIKKDSASPFSDAVVVNDTLYMSGRIGLTPGSTHVPDDLKEEINLLMRDVQSVLAAAEMTFEHLTFVQVFCPDVGLWEAFNAVYLGYFSQNLPARAFLGSGELLFGAHFELQAIAVR